MIQDVIPWNYVTHPPLGADVAELQAQNKNFCMITSNEIATTDFSQFKEIIIASFQPKSFYDNLFPGGVVAIEISQFTENGGIISANLADSMYVDNWFGYTFIGGLMHQYPPAIEDLVIADPNHPIIAGNLPCPGGNCGLITDNDIDNWSASSHGYFTNLPPNTNVILEDSSGNPVMIEYPFGLGRVIATLTTSEWMYNFGMTKLLANDIAYQDYLVVPPQRGILL